MNTGEKMFFIYGKYLKKKNAESNGSLNSNFMRKKIK